MIAAVSGRALAAAARRAGYRPFVADLFGDLDTIDMAEETARVPGALEGGLEAEGLIETLHKLAGEEPPEALICGSGFEEHPELLQALAQHFPLAGTNGYVVRRIKNPAILADECAGIGIPFPEIRSEKPPGTEGWLAKRIGGAGGLHIGPARQVEADESIYFQRVINGTNISALFMAEGASARIVGFSHQWTSPIDGAPYRFSGAVRLESFPEQDAAMIDSWLSALSKRMGLVGLCSADFIKARDTYYLIEINPRPGATLDIFDSDQAPLIVAHLAASRGEEAPLPVHRDSMALMIVYASHDIEHFPPIEWPDWLADRQPPGTRIASGEPICTIFAHGKSAQDAKALLLRREAKIQEIWAPTREVDRP